MASKLSKDDYQKALSAEWGFPVFLTDSEYERLSASKPLSKPTQPYQDPFAYVDEAKAAKLAAEKERKSKPEAWTTQPGMTYKREHSPDMGFLARARDAAADAGKAFGGGAPVAQKTVVVAAPPVLAGVPGPSKPVAPASGKIGKVGQPDAVVVKASGTPLTADTSYQLGANIVPEHLNPEADVEDLNNDPGGASMEEKLAAQQKYEMLNAADQIGNLPKTYKAGYAPAAVGTYVPQSSLPKWQSDEDEVNQMVAKYAALGK